jgi:hypothetical protein
VVIWYISSRFGMLYQEKSGNPVSNEAGKLCCHHVFISMQMKHQNSASFRGKETMKA